MELGMGRKSEIAAPGLNGDTIAVMLAVGKQVAPAGMSPSDFRSWRNPVYLVSGPCGVVSTRVASKGRASAVDCMGPRPAGNPNRSHRVEPTGSYRGVLRYALVALGLLSTNGCY